MKSWRKNALHEIAQEKHSFHEIADENALFPIVGGNTLLIKTQGSSSPQIAEISLIIKIAGIE